MRRASILPNILVLGGLIGAGALLLCYATAPEAEAATIEPGFADYLRTLDDQEMVTALLVLAEQTDVAGIRAALDAARATRAQRHAQVVTALRATAARSQPDLIAHLEGERARGAVADFAPHWISNLVVVSATKATVMELARRRDLAVIEANPKAQLIAPVGQLGGPEPVRGIGVTPGLRAIHADRVWRELGLTGNGILVANCDTGVDGKHPALAARWRGAQGHPVSECWLDVLGSHPNFPVDDDNHGTHVMGTITGLGRATGDTIGVAWNATWIASNAIGQTVHGGFNDDIIATFEWFADPDGDPGTVDDVPHIIQNSWGVTESFPGYEDCDSRWWAVIDNCEAAGAATTWSAGNNGPGYYTIGSPADRIASPVSSFSVGALDATHAGFPYPIADFSSRGPSGCDSLTMKPEVAAPGVDVYSSIPGGKYRETGWSGTSMAGPHVAGTVALLCEANPNLSVDELKQILLSTAVDLGRPGEDNVFGRGLLDAYAACLMALGPHGSLTGVVTNASNGGTPIPGAMVRADALQRGVPAQISGSYQFLLPPDTYTITANHPSFMETSAPDVQVLENQTTPLSFSLDDIGAPALSGTTQLPPTENTTGPYVVETTVADFSALHHVTLFYRVNEGTFTAAPMTPVSGQLFRRQIPGMPYGSTVEYYVEAADIVLNTATDPAGAPAELYEFLVVPIEQHFADTVENGAGDWTHAPATSGFGDAWHVSDARNHTSGGTWSWRCGPASMAFYADSLDAALMTPPVTIPEDAELRFWHWVEAESSYAYPGYAYDGGIVEISVDGGDWQWIYPVEGYPYVIRVSEVPGPFAEGTPVFSGTADWTEACFDLSAYPGEIQLRFRFGTDGAVGAEGWYIDDVIVRSYDYAFAGANEARVERPLTLCPADPNPFSAKTRLRFDLSRPGDARLDIYDPAGRLVRTLFAGRRAAGVHALYWDGRGSASELLPSGVYFSRLAAAGTHETRKLILAR